MQDFETEAWKTVDVEDLWALDKLILSRVMGYVAGPVGVPVLFPGEYIVRPCVNALDLGLGAEKAYISENTDHLPVGHFWCEWFEGDHYSVDYFYGEQYMAIQGFKSDDTFTRWNHWVMDDQKYFDLPEELGEIPFKYPWINCEFIGGRLIEVHFRRNQDFWLMEDQKEFIPVWLGEDPTPLEGYKYVEYPDVHGRIGAFIR